MRKKTNASKGSNVDTVQHKIVTVKKTSQKFKSTGEILTVYDGAIDRFLEIIPEPDWIEWKKQRGEIIIKSPDTNRIAVHVTREDVLWFCRITPASWIKKCIEKGNFTIDL